MVKATSKEAGAPKAKYVRKIVLAVWEQVRTSNWTDLNASQPDTTVSILHIV